MIIEIYLTEKDISVLRTMTHDITSKNNLIMKSPKTSELKASFLTNQNVAIRTLMGQLPKRSNKNTMKGI